jgi:DNA-binding NarL/FixJ family response regulator
MSLLILVVDDEPSIRFSVSHALEKIGYSVITAENGKEALSLLEEYQPHLMITDVAMPEMDGYELIRWVRQRPEFRLLPVVFLTGRTETEERIRGYQMGGDAYLPKPFELDELYAVIRNLLERSQLISQLMQWEMRLRTHAYSTDKLSMAARARYLNVPESISSPTATVSRHQLHSQTQTTTTASITQISLTSREQAVLKFLAQGLSNSQIATNLFLSPRTVEKYVSNLLGKTGTSNRVELLRFALENNLLERDDL